MKNFRGYQVTREYGPIPGSNKFHTGIDLVKSHKAPIQAFTSGEVLYAGEGKDGTGFGGYGNVVLLVDKNNRGQLYAHLDSVKVTKGQHVKPESIVGYQGETGYTTGSHLHFEVRKVAESSPPYGWRADRENNCLNPTKYLQNYNSGDQNKKLTLRNGNVGEEVEKIQQKLVSLGYSLPKYGIDGRFGDETEAAVRIFQSDQNITVDGIVGPVTHESLDKAIADQTIPYPGSTFSRGSTGENVRRIQRIVNTRVDGIYGPKTETAVKKFQSNHNLLVDGIVGPNTWKVLF
ncbi:peptidoglycan-binding protein [Aquibacillus koreensis]|uniref:Peptidoglycan-binding protein n=1 Tax=Aquibacillus koreensis TaxID=279446 RepID=A0A9X4AJ35_9BACI|nr:peptidoglycan-binding protein [Aquibacillus koreensis]MCT2536305.1 peptidoglycan-binding protein [Aquibacillus koreensis]MDC3421344.1 peptidoglycan-binding protein [Aquibacillus koreensis]